MSRLYVAVLLVALLAPLLYIPPAKAEGFYVMATTDSPIYLQGTSMRAETLVINPYDHPVTVRVEWSIVGVGSISFNSVTLTVPGRSTRAYAATAVSEPVTVSLSPGTYTLETRVYYQDTLVGNDTVTFDVVSGLSAGGKPILVVLVWNNHQMPNYKPGGLYDIDNGYFSMWHLSHFWDDGLYPFYPDMGTYYLHYYLLEKYPNVHANEFFSPSLIYQLKILATETGFKVADPNNPIKQIYYPPGSEGAQKILGFFQNLTRLERAGRVNLLTSVYAHTILGYQLHDIRIPDLIRYELEWGRNVTHDVFGVLSDSAWTPEMSFDMQLVDLYNITGIRYTALDEFHFQGVIGDKGTMWEPYIVRSSTTGREIIVFFREREISEGMIAFPPNPWNSPEDADEAARTIIRKIYQKFLGWNDPYGRPPVITIGGDGENWIIAKANKGAAAYFLGRLYEYLDSTARANMIRAVTFQEAVRMAPPKRVLTYVPYTSWSYGGHSIWTSSPEQKRLWEMANHAVGAYKAYRYFNGIDTYEELKAALRHDPVFYNACYDLIHALDSDPWHAHYFSAGIIEAWLNDYWKYMDRLLVTDIEFRVPGPLPEGRSTTVPLVVENSNSYAMKTFNIEYIVSSYVWEMGRYTYREILHDTEQLSVNPKDSAEIQLTFTVPSKSANVSFEAYAWTPNARYDSSIKQYFYSSSAAAKVLKPVDTSLRVSILDPTGRIIIPPTPCTAGTQGITAVVETENPVDTLLLVTVELYIDGRLVGNKTIEIMPGEAEGKATFTVDLSPGTYNLTVVSYTPLDPNPGNNRYTTSITVKPPQKPAETGGGGDYTLLAVGVVAVLAVLVAAVYFLVGRKTS